MGLMIISCSTNAVLYHCGLKRRNKCCVASAAVLDALMSGVLIFFGIVGLMKRDWFMLIINIITGFLFLMGYSLGCVQCSAVQPEKGQNHVGQARSGPVILGSLFEQAKQPKANAADL